MSGDPGEATAWRLRSREFGDLVVRHDLGRPTVAMQFAPQSIDDRWPAVQDAWFAVRRHPNVIEALGTDGRWMLLRYAAIDWNPKPVEGREQIKAEMAWISQLASAYRHLWQTSTSRDAIGCFANPMIRFDVAGNLRVLFRPAETPPEVRKRNHTWDEQVLVHLVGRRAREFVRDASVLSDVVARCIGDQFATLEAVIAACAPKAGARRHGALSAAWREVEEGIGWLQLEGDPSHIENAVLSFGYALDHAAYAFDPGGKVRTLANWGRDTAYDRGGSAARSVSASEPVALDWSSAVAWRKRDFVFGDLRVFDDGRPVVAMECLPGTSTPGWQYLREAWLALERPCAILDALAPERNELLVRYAALNWRLRPLIVDTPDRERTAAAWLVDIIDAYKVILDEQPDEILHFLNPLIRIDLNLRPRIAFLATPAQREDLPPEATSNAPAWDERSLVFHVGAVMKKLVRFPGEVDTAFRMVLDACCRDRPWKRWKSLDAVVEAVTTLGFDVDELRKERRPDGWNVIEEGFGWLEIGENERAVACFEGVSAPPFVEMAAWGKTQALERIETAKRADEIPLPDPARLTRTASGSFTMRHIVRSAAVPPPRWPVPLPEELSARAWDALRRARESLHLGDIGTALTFANHARTDDETRRAATLILAEVYLRRRDPAKALELLDPMLAEAEDGSTIYVRAKALFIAGRLHEAREGFERAFALSPNLLEAMLLRREVDRALGNVRAKVGDASASAVKVPAELSELRDVLLSGDSRKAIAALDDPRYANEPEAQLVLARFMCLDGQHDLALDVYDRVTAEPHRFIALLGKATTLLDLGRTESALALLDQLVTEKPADAEASEGRARALEKLERIGEAAAEYRRFISLATAGSDLRVRAAQAWLDAHPL